MIRSVYSAISSLSLHQKYMDVVADNLSNVNTTAFKASRVLFQDLFSQLDSPGSGPNVQVGGINPVQVGLGVKVGYISPTFTQGTLNSTGRTADMAIQGDGFFIFKNGEGSTTYSREGSLQVDSDGFLVNSSSGLRLQGWYSDKTKDPDIDPNIPTKDLQIPLQRSIATETTKVTLAGNLNSTSAIPAGVFDPVNPTASNDPAAPLVGSYYDVTVGLYDSLGVEKTTTIRLTRQPTITVAAGPPAVYNSPWSVTIEPTMALSGHTMAKGTGAATPGTICTVIFDDSGQVTSINGVAIASTNDLNFTTTTLPVITVPGTDGASETQIMLDPRNLSQLSQFNTVAMASRDGLAPGAVTDIDISSDNGELYIVYSNGEREKLGQVALARFSNPTGLIRTGGSMYREGVNSGTAQIGAPNTGGRGTVNPGYLEGSNVDMGMEFTNMILAQRGFQAATRVITTGDQMLQELVNLKR